MASIREYLEKKETEELQGILRNDFAGRDEIPVDIVLLICTIIRERNPEKKTRGERIRNFWNII